MKDMTDNEKALRVRTDARQMSVLDFFKGSQQKAAQLQEIKRGILTDDVLRKMHADFNRWRQDRKNDVVCNRKLSETATLAQILRDSVFNGAHAAAALNSNSSLLFQKNYLEMERDDLLTSQLQRSVWVGVVD